ncbi:hypothetical protein [Planctobacterium marinum]|uniref:hypothetical protein n=1 Tax=Planctobacterium marinum TaxID=1631968 RepID=UPI001E354782|nr:hypothetical protein [Planctobacterium marinum]MCC2604987.1 hypothetical protein [Planctobacterium marinum]
MSIKLLLHFSVAVLTTFCIASIAHSQFVLAALTDVGVTIPLADRLSMTLSDLIGLLPGYGAIILLSLLVGFLIVEGLSRWVRPLPAIRYPVAGLLAMCCALLAMHPIFNVSLIAGARTELGFLSQILAGAVGGWVFMQCRKTV